MTSLKMLLSNFLQRNLGNERVVFIGLEIAVCMLFVVQALSVVTP